MSVAKTLLETGERKALEALLTEAGIELSLAEVLERLAGIAAAPSDTVSGPALEIISPVLDGLLNSDLDQKLRSLILRIARRYELSLSKTPAAERLELLRNQLRRLDLDGFIVPRTDEHQGEYVSFRAQRLAWLTGFDGSAGVAIVLSSKAAIFVDGRYTLQARDQVDEQCFEQRHVTDEPPEEWLATNAGGGARIGYDPWLHTVGNLDRYRKAMERIEADIVAVDINPIDAVWDDQPAPPLSPIIAHEAAFTGETTASKRMAIGDAMRKKGADVAVLTAPDSIAWLLNIRGGDMPNSPLPSSFALASADGRLDWFVDRRKLTGDLSEHLGNQVCVRDPEELGPRIETLANEAKTVLIDPVTAPAWIVGQLDQGSAKVVRAVDPCQLPKACKNPVELDGMRAAHVRDGAALSRFLAWVSATAPATQLDEISAAQKLAEFRSAGENFRGLSFDTISGAGANGAIVHYRVSGKTCRPLRSGELYLVDSGAQYLDGTTDVTRTIAIGAPSAEMRDRFTRVLKGHIGLATCRFPVGTTGSQLDILARLALWEVGLDYDHGTGHGVGSYLSVHEGPQRIAKIPNKVPLKPGMILSNEPGYYRTGEYGIRIENLVAVVECDKEPEQERAMLSFETLTLAPIDLTLVDPALLGEAGIKWLNRYHKRVFDRISPLVDDATVTWLQTATAEVAFD